MLQNPHVMYAYEHTFSDRDVKIWLDRQTARYRRHGFGLWAACLKSTGEMVGQAGLAMQRVQEKEALEIGYLLKEKFWRRGYATEAALACREYAFGTLGQDKVHCIIKPDNTASKQVAERIGMHREREFLFRGYHGDVLHELYSVQKKRPASHSSLR